MKNQCARKLPIEIYIGSPPKNCDLCNAPISNVFVDGVVQINQKQIWANVCKTCHLAYGKGLGTGLGQEWWIDIGTNNFVKIEG
jgi:hypothetical protein